MRTLYSILLYLLLPAMFLRLWWKSRRLPAYRRHWAERLAWRVPDMEGALWLHAVSVGEVRAAAALLEAQMARHPDKPVLVTTTTPMGRETVRQLFGERVTCVYLPYDVPPAVRRFVHSVRPAMALIVEVELWPNLFAALAARQVPLYLINARLSPHSYRGYRRLGGLMRETVARITAIGAQTEADRQHFMALGAPAQRTRVTGNLKLDGGLPADYTEKLEDMRDRIRPGPHTWLAASTHPGEETPLLDAHRQVIAELPDALLILVPRHPERADELTRLSQRAGLVSETVSSAATRAPETRVMIVDRIGLLVYLYGLAPVAFLGGSLVDKGGHNPVEAILAGSSLIMGPYDGNFRDICQWLEQAGGLTRVSPATTGSAVLAAINSPKLRESQAARAAEVIAGQGGALQRTLDLIAAP